MVNIGDYKDPTLTTFGIQSMSSIAALIHFSSFFMGYITSLMSRERNGQL